MKLNLGCGEDIREGWVNVDLYIPADVKADARKLPYHREVDEILASHLLEHFWYSEALAAVLEWKRVLKPGGKLCIVVPDAEWAFKIALEKGVEHNVIQDGESEWATPMQILYGIHQEGREHHMAWTRKTLEDLLTYLYFTDVEIKTEWDVWHQILVATAVKPDDAVDIVIPIWEGKKWTERCIESLETTHHPYRLILVDDASTDGTSEYLNHVKECRPDTILIKNDKNLGFVKSMNLGLEASDAPFVMWLNNDSMIFEHDYRWLDRMLLHFRGRVGAVGPTSDFVWGFQKHNFEGLPQHHEILSLSGFCMLVSRRAADAVGPLDERFGVGGNDDLDYSIRLTKAGYHMAIARDVCVKHEGSCSLKPYTEIMYGRKGIERDLVDRLDRETRVMLVNKWGEATVDGIMDDYRGWHIKGTIKLH